MAWMDKVDKVGGLDDMGWMDGLGDMDWLVGVGEVEGMEPLDEEGKLDEWVGLEERKEGVMDGLGEVGMMDELDGMARWWSGCLSEKIKGWLIVKKTMPVHFLYIKTKITHTRFFGDPLQKYLFANPCLVTLSTRCTKNTIRYCKNSACFAAIIST